MRIDVIGEDKTITADVRAYAEYRLFAMLARYAELVRSARVVLRRAGRDRTGKQMVCSVTVALEPSGYARARVSKPRRVFARSTRRRTYWRSDEPTNGATPFNLKSHYFVRQATQDTYSI